MNTIREIKNYNDYMSFRKMDEEVLHIIKLGAEWCGPCKQMSTIISNLDIDKIGNTLFAEVDIEEENTEDIVNELNIRSIPVTLFIKNNTIIDKKIGSLTADNIYNLIKKYK